MNHSSGYSPEFGLYEPLLSTTYLAFISGTSIKDRTYAFDYAFPLRSAVSFAPKKLIRISFQSATAAGTGAHVSPYRFYRGGRAREKGTFMLSKTPTIRPSFIVCIKKKLSPRKYVANLNPLIEFRDCATWRVLLYNNYSDCKINLKRTIFIYILDYISNVISENKSDALFSLCVFYYLSIYLFAFLSELVITAYWSQLFWTFHNF